VIKLDGDFLIN